MKIYVFQQPYFSGHLFFSRNLFWLFFIWPDLWIPYQSGKMKQIIFTCGLNSAEREQNDGGNNLFLIAKRNACVALFSSITWYTEDMGPSFSKSLSALTSWSSISILCSQKQNTLSHHPFPWLILLTFQTSVQMSSIISLPWLPQSVTT